MEQQNIVYTVTNGIRCMNQVFIKILQISNSFQVLKISSDFNETVWVE